jgi:hypothetical protein
MPNYSTYSELSDLKSRQVMVIDNYHGMVQSQQKIQNFDCSTMFKKVTSDIIVLTSLGEKISQQNFECICKNHQDKFVILVTTQSYPALAVTGKNYKIFKIPSAYSFYSTKIPYEIISSDRVFEKIFLSLNYRGSWNRQAMAQFVLSHSLQHKMYFSYHCADRFGTGQQKLYDDINQIIGSEKTWYNQNINNDWLFAQLPITTGLETLYANNDWSLGHKNYYERSFCSVVNETYIDNDCDPFFTEKVFKPIAYLHPFLLFSSAGALEYLKDLGFQTFSDYFDESYDNIQNAQIRFEAILKEMIRLSSYNQDQLEKLYQAMKPILRNNFDTFWRTLPARYVKDILIIKEKISQVLQDIR